MERFRDPDFSKVKWINSALAVDSAKVTKGKKKTDAQISSLTIKLQAHCQEMSKRIESRMEEAMAVVPAIVREIRRIRGAAASLQECIDSVETKSIVGHGPVESLRDFHVVKKNLVACSSTLAEAANWDNLTSVLDDNLRTRNLPDLSKNLELMRKSLTLLEHMPNAEIREKALARAEQRVENLIIMSDLLEREGTLNAKELATHVELFRKVGREKQLQALYVEKKRQALHLFWESFGGETDFRSWLRQFYNRLSLFLAKEKSVCKHLFARPFEALCDALGDILEPLAESFEERLRASSTCFSRCATYLR